MKSKLVKRLLAGLVLACGISACMPSGTTASNPPYTLLCGLGLAAGLVIWVVGGALFRAINAGREKRVKQMPPRAISFPLTDQQVAAMRRLRGTAASEEAADQAAAPGAPDIQVVIAPQRRTVQATEQIVTPSAGADVRVARSRTIDHSVMVNWQGYTGGALDLGFKGLVNASIQKAIENSLGRAYEQSETYQQEIYLHGGQDIKYRIVWTDTILEGVAEYALSGKVQRLPFQFTEKTELEVLPVG